MFLTIAGCTSQRYAQYRHGCAASDTLAMMKKQDVISLTKAGVSDSLIITMLATSHSWFQLNTQDVLDLKTAGVSEKVINAMLVSNDLPADGDRHVENGNYYYPPYYWYDGYYPYWYTRRSISDTVIIGRSMFTVERISAVMDIGADGEADSVTGEGEVFF